MCTGLEPLFAFAGSAAPALATGVGALGAGALAGQVLKPSVPAPAPQTVTKPPAPVKKPERPAAVQANAAAAGPGGAMSGNSSTFLTGPSGIDPSALNLGMNTLLGR
jgi:hypothetical protein